ncbi:hypothetical protein EDD11_006574 [Mortierella claussenii]|nr:hypothetical protein EDD11_006574 [Mortierella claussenii]
MFPRNIYDSQNNDPSHHLHQAAAASGSNPANPQGGQNQEFRPYAHFALQDTHAHGVQPVFGQVHDAPPSPCRSRDRVYLPDMQSFLIKTPLTYQEAIQACIACGSELVLVDGTNVDRFREAFSSLGLYGDQRFWIKR